MKRGILLLGILVAVAALFYFLKTKQGAEPLAETAAQPRPGGKAPEGMVWIPGGQFVMGSEDPMAWEEERPAHPAKVNAFWMLDHEVTNAEFAAFVKATGYKTDAEKTPLLEEIMAQLPPGTPPPAKEDLVPGALVFTPTKGPVPLGDITQWWSWTHGADWQHPEGVGSSIQGRENHPVVQISWNDAQAYCHWAGMRLPTEAEWEFAARGGLKQKNFVWGDEMPGETKIFANTWQGHFPDRNTKADGFERTAPVKSFKPNGYGLYDMAGNVWEWCSDWYDLRYYTRLNKEVVQDNPQGPEKSYDPAQPYTPLRVQKGGSFLCHDSYCWRYRPSARQSSSPESGMSHLSFRPVMTQQMWEAKQNSVK